MLVHKELCPRCQSLRSMRVSISRRKVTDPEGGVKEILTKSFHCGTCHSFVRSEDIEEPEETPSDPSYLLKAR